MAGRHGHSIAGVKIFLQALKSKQDPSVRKIGVVHRKQVLIRQSPISAIEVHDKISAY